VLGLGGGCEEERGHDLLHLHSVAGVAWRKVNLEAIVRPGVPTARMPNLEHTEIHPRTVSNRRGRVGHPYVIRCYGLHGMARAAHAKHTIAII